MHFLFAYVKKKQYLCGRKGVRLSGPVRAPMREDD